MNDRSSIALLGEGLAVGEQAYETCPECGRDKKLSLKRTPDGLLYYCLRATCGYKGFTGNLDATTARADTAKGISSDRKIFAPKPFTGRLEPLTPDQQDWFGAAFELDRCTLGSAGVRYAPDKDGYSFPVRTPRFWDRGLVLRYYNNTKPKTVAYREHDGPWLAWYSHTAPIARRRVIVVEDQVSAMKASAYMPAVALLGTGLSTSGAIEIADTQPLEVIIALDYDATAQAYNIARTYELLFRSVRVLPLEQDIKDTPHAELESLLSE